MEGDALDLRKPTDEVVIVRYWGIDLPGAEILQDDGSWKRHGHEAGRRFIRPDAERWVAEHAAEMRGMTINLWIALQR